MATWLEKLKTKEISLVDRGANPGAVSVLMKRASKMGDDAKEMFNKMLTAFGVKPEEVNKILGGETMDFEKIIKGLQEQVEKLTKRAESSDSIGKISVALSKAKSKKEVKEQEEEVEKLDKNDPRYPVLKEMVTELLTKSAHHDAYSANLNGDEKTKFEAMPMKEKDAYMSKNPAAEGEGEEVGEGEGKEEDEVEKRLKVEIAKRQTLEAKVEKMEKATTIQKIMSEDLKELKGIEKMEPIAEAIYALRKSNSSEADVLVATLKKQAAQLKASDKMLQELGKAAQGPADGSAEAQLDALSVEKSKRDGISKAAAMGKILDTPEGAELYKRIEEEKSTK